MGTVKVTFNIGNFDAPPNSVVTAIKCELLNNADAVVDTHSLPGNATGDQFDNVAPGTDYKCRMTTFDQNNNALGSPALTNSVNVDSGTVTVQIVIGGTASVA